MAAVVRRSAGGVHGARRLVPFSLLLGGAAILASGCGIVKAIEHKALNDLSGRSKVVNDFTAKLDTNTNAPYVVTYETTGASPATVTFAASPPNDFLFEGSVTSGRLLQNSTGFYACTESTSGGWSCTKMSSTTFDTEKTAYALYSGAYWTDFLKVYSTVAGLAGVSIKASTKSVNGFAMQCVVINGGRNSPGTSTFCETSQGILGYVQATSNGTAFEIKSYQSNPPASLFALPAGATVETIPTTVPAG